MKKLNLLLILMVGLFVVSCAKKEIPTGVEEAPPPAVKKESAPQTKPAEEAKVPSQETPKLSEPPIFEEVGLEPQNPEWIDAHREELLLYGRSTRPFKAIFFDFDSYYIRDDMKDRLQENARFLLENPEIKVELQGNCDERGSSEYNLALGEKRALAVKRYLINLGVSPERLITVSFGEERPLDPRHNEEAWALNRRVDFVVIKK
ncbi:peptidoglycan-associated lipoprotein [Thermodesulfatator indicus DSM 15286]|uniref:Peptidoglycan-associated lipoprotein n=1 Tax=Thermodesulfatator indicus (strain DSM 15286 / JCM 11887 / CIR29812) TaxID=667014 RepID=F8AE39_THEID|nr:peptidoglycan-associated lipoprotein Pal [Thermodesulfatator indicus]AEH43974.1 peptidoglycan-associated lipoprotein [Thermodesulfatator indicus DSM 15286]